MSSPLTPKAIGQYVGTVKSINRNDITVAGTAAFSNGDGLCFSTEMTSCRDSESTGHKATPYSLKGCLPD